MYKLLTKFNHIDNYSVFNDNLLYFKEGFLYLNNSRVIINDEKIIGGYIDFQGISNIVTHNKVYWYNIFDILIVTEHFSGFLNIEVSENVRLFRNINLHYCFYDLQKKEIIKTFKAKFNNLYPSAYVNGCLFIHKFPEQIIQSLSLLTGLYKWEVPLNRNGEIFKVLGVRENELVVCFKQGLDYYGLLGIAIETGKIMWNIDDNFLLNGLNMSFTSNQASIFSTKGEGRNSYFIELDLTTKQAIRYGEIVDLCKEKLAISTSFLKDDLVYFTAGNHTFFPNTIGIFDYKTLKLLWKHTFSFDKHTHLKEMQVAENKLYVLDSGGTLHIFEKENVYNEII